MGRLFGTDGARGVANAELTPELAMNIGRAAAMVLISDEVEHPTILIGKDTRLSCDMLEGALIAGLYEYRRVDGKCISWSVHKSRVGINLLYIQRI
ncbi:protein containing Alpha-D-phosphohexomutase, alpha/beta/alpha domain protein I domain protein, partial [human gut metagenome]